MKPTAFVIAAAIVVSGCTAVRMAGFDALAARPDVERIDVSGIPGWANGTFRLDTTIGTVRRYDGGEAVGWGPSTGRAQGDVRTGTVARYGTIEFFLKRPEVGGKLEGRCRYHEQETRGSAFGLDLTLPVHPLRMTCAYFINGRRIGELEIQAAAPRTLTAIKARLGTVRVNGTELDIRSTHALDDSPFGTSDPIGYVLGTPDGETVAAIELNGFSRRRMILPRDGGVRAPALAAMLTLALFWDPANSD